MHRTCALREDTPNVILDAADRLIARFGYRKTTVEDVAREAGVGKGTIYLYFPSKEELALSLADRKNEHIRERLRCILRGAGPPVARLHRMLVARVMLRLDVVTHYGDTWEELLAALRTAYIARRERWLEAEAGLFAEILAEGRVVGVFEYEDALDTARALLLATTGLLPSNLGPQELAARHDVERRAARLADLLIRSLRRCLPGVELIGWADHSTESVIERG